VTAKRVLFVITEDWALISHRLHLVDAAIAAGYEVGLVTRVTKHRKMLEARGVKLFEWHLQRRSLNPLREIMVLINLCQIFWLFKPDIIHAVAQKPVIYAGFARKFYDKAAFIGALGGVGFVFTGKSFKAKVLRPLVKLFLKFALMGERTRLILQNNDNINIIQRLGVIDAFCIRLVRGAGVETEKFLPSPMPTGVPMVILPARMLWDKGVGEFVRVAGRIKARDIQARFVLVGDIDLHNPASVSQAQIDNWVASGTVEQWGRRGDMELVYPQASIVCLPSYNEGLPKVLLEAASSSRPVVAFDVSGCRDVARDGVNGALVAFGDEAALQTALVRLIEDKKLCQTMGENGRKIVETEFSSVIINAQTFAIWNEVA
jgi:glycosyltransferase involved in cell wall biosynthesis